MTQSVQLHLKHAGKMFTVDIDLAQPSNVFKDAIFQATGVPQSRQKVMVKGGMLKDNADLTKLGLANGQTIMVIGTAGPLPSTPAQVTLFAEDVSNSDLVKISGQVSHPGLTNLGNTCYMNASLQALRAIPQLNEALDRYRPSASQLDPHARLTSQTKHLFKSMATSPEPIPPIAFLQTLRQVSPQFAETSQHGGYAQQDADEMWTQTISALHSSLRSSDGEGSLSFVDAHLSCTLQQTLTCDEAPEEAAAIRSEKILKLDCNISSSTNYLLDGIKESFDQQIEKTSPTLGRTAIYNQKSRLDRLPSTLTIHMVRFYWRADIQKKAKIMRKVRFPMDLDVTDLLSEGLKHQVGPINTAMKTIDKNRQQRTMVLKKSRKAAASTVDQIEAATTSSTENSVTSDLPNEETERAREREEVKALLATQGLTDREANCSALYELAAVVTHKGASADSGHYIGWTRQPGTAETVPGEEDWWKFDDENVSTVTKDQILALDGGGEASIAYILVYRSKMV